MNLGIYTWGGAGIGSGHLLRSLALLEWFDVSLIPYSATIELYAPDRASLEFCKSLLESLTSHNVRPHVDPMLDGCFWDVLVIDRLDVPVGIMCSLRERSSVLVSIDERGESRDLADVAVNPLYRPFGSLTRGRQFVGLEYQIIRPSFARSVGRLRNRPKNIFLCQGGSDVHGLTPEIAEMLLPILEEFPDVRLHVLAGYSETSRKRLRLIGKRLGRRFVLHHSVSNMPKLIRKMDVAVSSGGVLAFELAAVGCPLVLVTGENKETETCAAIALTGGAITLGLFSPDVRGSLTNTVRGVLLDIETRRSMRCASLNQLRGDFGLRLVHMIQSLCSQIRTIG